MPHISIEYSGNVEPEIDVGALCEHMRKAAASLVALPMPGLRVRAFRADYWAVADGTPAHSFIDVSVRLRSGRSMEVRRDVSNRLFGAVREFVAPYIAVNSLALSLELRDIDPDLSPKTGTIREHLAGNSQ